MSLSESCSGNIFACWKSQSAVSISPFFNATRPGSFRLNSLPELDFPSVDSEEICPNKKGNILKFPLDQGMSVGLNWAIYEYISFPHALGGVRFESLLECL